MKRIAALACAFVVAMTASTTADVASAQSTAAPNCQHSSGDGVIIAPAYVVNNSGTPVGAIQLCRNTGSPYYWAYIVFYGPMAAGNWGQAYLERYLDGVRGDVFTCESPGGNDHVAPGQTMCWTPKIYAPSSRVTFRAAGRACTGPYSTCRTLWAYGETVIRR